VIDHLDKGRAAGEPRIILVKAGLDDLLDMFFHGNSAKCWKTTPRSGASNATNSRSPISSDTLSSAVTARLHGGR